MNFLKNPIFNGITEQEYEEIKILGCTRKSQYAKNQTVFCTGDQTAALGILLSGELHIENIDLWGNRIILHNISAGEAFAETYALSRIPMLVDVTASTTFPQGKLSPRPTPSAASRCWWTSPPPGTARSFSWILKKCWTKKTAAGHGT